MRELEYSGTLIAIGISSGEFIHVDTMLNIHEMAATTDIPMTFVCVKGCFVHQNRNIICEEAMKLGCSHVMMIDTDMLFEADGLKRLLAHDKAVVGGNYNKRQHPLTAIVKEEITELSPVKFVPGGFMLIDLRKLKDLPKPWFFFDAVNNSDDSYFCTKVKEFGQEVWCDPTIKIRHIGEFLY